jgi:segregation and condensation protein B
MNKEQLKSVIEAMVFASDTPLTIHQMVSVLENFEKTEIEEVLTQIQQELEGRAFSLKKVSGGYQFASRPEFSRWIKKMYQGKERNRLTRAALETLAIIAFKQPISRVEVSAIRGVNSDGVIKGLLERKLITISGRGEGQGRALLFNTTPQFLQYFGINEISDLPKPKEIEELLAAGEAARIMGELEEASIAKEGADDQDAEEPTEWTEEELLVASEQAQSIEITLPAPETESETSVTEEATIEEIMSSGPVFSEEQLEQEMPSDASFLADQVSTLDAKGQQMNVGESQVLINNRPEIEEKTSLEEPEPDAENPFATGIEIKNDSN